jgi:hypothetical protein
MGERNFYKIDGRILSTPSKDLGPEEKVAEEKYVNEFMEDLFSAGKDSVYGELIKADEELLMIKDFDKYIRAEAIDLGVKDLRRPLPTRKIHFALPSGYQKQFPHLQPTAEGNYEIWPDAIYIKKNKDINRWDIAHVTLHEMIHAYSAIRYDLDSVGNINSAKLGYQTATMVKNESAKSTEGAEVEPDVSRLFLGFNEAITDLMTQEILTEHQAELTRDLKLSAEEIAASSSDRYGYCDAVEWIIAKIAEKNQEDKSVVWNKFKLGMLTGKIMHLREIEKTLGTGALRLIANMGNSREANLAVGAFMKNYDKNN